MLLFNHLFYNRDIKKYACKSSADRDTNCIQLAALSTYFVYMRFEYWAEFQGKTLITEKEYIEAVFLVHTLKQGVVKINRKVELPTSFANSPSFILYQSCFDRLRISK